MTTLEPGASVVFPHGLRSSPASTAFLATRAAPIMTDGLDVFVHDVIAAITTDPWSTDVVVPSSSVTSTGADARTLAFAGCSAGSRVTTPFFSGVNGSDAGNVSAISSSRLSSWTYAPRACRNESLASVSATRSCGRFGPASDGTTWSCARRTPPHYLAGL